MASKKFACAVAVMCMVVLGALVSEAIISCEYIQSELDPCHPYLASGPGPSGPCCDGVGRVNATASTTPDRQAACYCLKKLADGFPDLNYDNAAALPDKCGVDIRIPASKIRPDIDCTTITL